MPTGFQDSTCLYHFALVPGMCENIIENLDVGPRYVCKFSKLTPFTCFFDEKEFVRMTLHSPVITREVFVVACGLLQLVKLASFSHINNTNSNVD